jgi:hypothetical protein
MNTLDTSYADQLIALVERLNAGDDTAWDEFAAVIRRRIKSAPQALALPIGTLPPGALEVYLRADALLRPKALVKAAASGRFRKADHLVSRERDGRRITVDRTLLRQLQTLAVRQEDE